MAAKYTSHIAVFAFPFGSHSAPLLTLVRRLSASAPTIKFSFFCTASSNTSTFSGLKNEDFDSVNVYNVWDGLPEGYKFSDNPRQLIDFFIKACPGNFKKGVEEAEAKSGLKVGCLLTDAFLWFSGEMAAEMGVPWVAFWTAGPCSLSIHMYTDLIRSLVQTTSWGTTKNAKETLKSIPGMSAIKIADLPEGVISGNLESPFAVMLHSMGIKLPEATAVVLNSFEEIDPTITNDLKSKLQKVLNVGPSTLSNPQPPASKSDDPNGCLSWLDKHKAASVTYISFGTVMAPPPNELAALAEALEEIQVPFLWSLRDNARQHLPEGFLERTKTGGKIVSWAPQLQVLAHASVAVFVTHCGWNSILESISYGVPMICRPFFGDQMLNSRMVEDVWRIGVRVEGGTFSKNSTMNAIDLILSTKTGEELRESIGVLKENAVRAVGSNGSSTGNFEALKEILTSI